MMNHSLTKHLWLLAVCLAAGTVTAEDLPPPEKTGGIGLASPDVIAQGLDLLNKTCGGYCHGTEARGFKAPSLRNRSDLSVDSLHATISYGRTRAGKMMPAWKGSLPDDAIWSAVAAIVSLPNADPPGESAPTPGGH